MQNRSNRNLGQTSLSARRRNVRPMQTYDALPTPLRHWLAQAALPWSPTSAKRIWSRAKQQGLGVEDTLAALARAESRTLARDRHSVRIPTQNPSI